MGIKMNSFSCFSSIEYGLLHHTWRKYSSLAFRRAYGKYTTFTPSWQIIKLPDPQNPAVYLYVVSVSVIQEARSVPIGKRNDFEFAADSASTEGLLGNLLRCKILLCDANQMPGGCVESISNGGKQFGGDIDSLLFICYGAVWIGDK